MKQVTVSYSELYDAQRCAYKHHLSYKLGYSPKKTSEALTFGTAWHTALEAYYEAIKTGEVNPLKAALQTINSEDEHRRGLEWMLDGYWMKYKSEPKWEVLATELKLVVDLPQLQPDLNVKLKTKIDLVIRDRTTGLVYVDDHKSIGREVKQREELGPQLPLYAYALRKEGWNIFGARYSYARKPTKTFLKGGLEPNWDLDMRFQRTPAHFTVKQSLSTAQDAYKLAYDRYMNPWGGEPSRSQSPDCKWCDFLAPCKAGRKGYDIQPFLDEQFNTYRPNDPKKPEEIE